MKGGCIMALALAAVAVLPGSAEPQPRTAVALRASGAITVDGRLDEPAWQQAPEHTGFTMPLGMTEPKPIPPEVQTAFRVLYDDDCLYLGITCREPEPAKVVTRAADQHDAAMWSDDAVEIFLDPVGEGKGYYQFAVNARGTQFDSYPTADGLTSLRTWSTQWQAATSVGEAAWTLEVAIPFGALDRTPATSWGDRWAFNVARTRAVAPGYNSVFSQTVNGYHDPPHFGRLEGVQVDRERYNLGLAQAKFGLTGGSAEGWPVRAEVVLENRGSKPTAGVLQLAVPGMEAGAGSQAFSLAPNGRQRLVVESRVPGEGSWPLVLGAVDGAGRLLFVRRFQESLAYRPLMVNLTQPGYRNCFYAGMPAAQVRGTIYLDRVYLGHRLQVALVAPDGSQLATADLGSVTARSLPFTLAIPPLAEGTYQVRATLHSEHTTSTTTEVASAQAPLGVVPPAPGVEVRVDGDGRLLIDGQPVFIRGWYGSPGYLTGAASTVASRLPHGTNFMLDLPPEWQADSGMYCLKGVDGLIDESKAKIDQPIDEALKARLREAVASVRGRHNVIGYYLSDEPECRGLSPVYLESAYRFLAQEDPYRLVMIVSRSPRDYMQACDVICPHPYLNPQQPAGGLRAFANPAEGLRKVMQEAVAANDGTKAVWCMPQVFRYNGPDDRHPNFAEIRWSVFSALANGATGIVPFIFNAYWNHLPNRRAMDRVFDELTWLAPLWLEGKAAQATTEAPVDVSARVAAAGHLVMVAVTRGTAPCRATVRLPMLASSGLRRLLVLSENRVVPVEADGSFTDDFPALGAHVYTTLEVLPILPTLGEVEREMAEAERRNRASGNLLADPKVAWTWVDAGWNFSEQGDLADGVTDAAAWLPAYGDRTKCEIAFARPVRFSGVVVHTPTIRSARLEIWQQNKWQVLHTWTDQFLPTLEYQGKPVSATRLRIVPTAMRQGPTGPGFPEITELGLYR